MHLAVSSGSESSSPDRETAEVIEFPIRPVTGSDVRESLGGVLRDERVDQERTLADVAEDAAVSLAYLSEVERGRKDVSADVLTAIGGALGLEVPMILERTARRLRVQGGVVVSMQLLAA